MAKPEQIPLSFPVVPAMGRADFLSSSANLTALTRIEAWPNWPHPVLVLHGGRSAGKTHLASIWLERCQNDPRCQLVDDFDERLGTRASEEPLFHLYNRVVAERGFLLLTATRPPVQLDFALPDLASRLRACPSIGIEPPDDALLSALVVKLFADRKLSIEPEVLAYIVSRVDRQFAAVRELVAKADALALAQHRAITLPLVRSLLQSEQTELF